MWSLDIAGVDIEENSQHLDVEVEYLRSSQEVTPGSNTSAQFDILIARDKTSWQVVGGLALNHTVEFMEHGITARGFALDNERKIKLPKEFQDWNLQLTK